MSDNTSPEEYQAEIAMLNHEICELQKKLDQQTAQQNQAAALDKYDPFCNPTEYPGYSGDYSDIVPQIEIPGCEIPVSPGRGERKRLRHFYTIGGTSMALHFVFTTVLTYVLSMVIMLILQWMNPEISYETLYNYAYSSSVLVAVSIIVYLTANVLFAYMGLKWAKVPFSSLINTRDFSFAKAFQYCFSAIFIQYAAAILCTGISDIFEKYGFSTDISDDGYAQAGAAFLIYTLYACIIAPITEELLFRGMLLKTFSRANQRFGIIASAVFFGLAHGNLPQFLLAFLLGIFLAHIDMKHNSLLPSVIVHIFVNTTATVMNYITTRHDDQSTLIIVNLIYMLMAMLGLIMIFEFLSKNRLPSTTPHQSRRGFAVAGTSIAVAAAFAAELILTVMTIVMTKYS